MTLANREDFMPSPDGDKRGVCHECGIATALYENQGDYVCAGCLRHRIFDHQNGEGIF